MSIDAKLYRIVQNCNITRCVRKHPIGIMPERICKYRITLYAFAKGNPFAKKRKSTARNGNEMEMNGMKSNRLNEMEGIFQLKSSSKKYL